MNRFLANLLAGHYQRRARADYRAARMYDDDAESCRDCASEWRQRAKASQAKADRYRRLALLGPALDPAEIERRQTELQHNRDDVVIPPFRFSHIPAKRRDAL